MADTGKLNGGPTKRFFVSMLTKDIALEDAILDLIDNSVDGAMRSKRTQDFDVFEGFEAKLDINDSTFTISDNCGGIPESYVDDAFSLGRPSLTQDGDLPTIGMFGIGMKRAIFKMGSQSLVASNSDDGYFEVEYSTAWMEPENNEWELPIERNETRSDDDRGVTIIVDKLKPEIVALFKKQTWINSLEKKISQHFGYLMQRGFKVFLNGEQIQGSTVPLYQDMGRANDAALNPFDFEGTINDVNIKVTVGLFRPLAREQEIDEEAVAAHPEDHSGISVICNDRVILLQDKSMTTGWGDGTVPRFHPQFRSISGVILLSSNNAQNLPLSTTKRGLDAGSDVYLKARQQCMDGIKMFTTFTNRWKGRERSTDAMFKAAPKADARTGVKLAVSSGKELRAIPGAKRYEPKLPEPPRAEATSRITFVRPKSEVQLLAREYFDNEAEKPGIVGEQAFENELQRVKE